MAAILTYHHIAVAPAQDRHRGLFVSPDQFAAQMAYLAARRWKVVPLDEVRDDLLGRRRLPRRAVAITFDDGGADNYANALPVLRRHEFTATVFAVAGQLGQTRDKPGWPDEAARYLDETEIARLVEAGIEIGSHTLSHGRLTRMDPDTREREVVDSKRGLEQLTGRRVGWISYPFGSFSQAVLDSVRQAGYVGGVSTIRDNRPTRERLFFLPRVMVMPDVSLRHFGYYFSPWYHWVHRFKNRRRWGKHERLGTE